jgi:signal transduction histidine kinase
VTVLRSPDDVASSPRSPEPGWRRAGLRPRLTLLSTALVALVSALLLWLGWLLVGRVAGAAPALPPGSLVRVGGVDVPAEQVSAAVGAALRAEVLRAGLIAYPLVVLAAGVVSWWLVGRVLGPLHAVTATARRLSAESLDTRLALRDARGEVAELAAGFDAMLDRLQAAFDAQRRFVANASHELRTPLSVLRTEVDVTLADPDVDVDELRRMGEVVREATRRADELIAGLLLLARSEAPSAVDPAAVRPVDLVDVVVPALAAARAEVTRRGLHLRESRSTAPTTGDVVLLERVAGNLIENAVWHNVAAGWLEVSTGVRGTAAELRVTSSGPEIAPDRVEELFEPFRRGPVDRTSGAPGSGLGLSIVRAVVHAHGGTVAAEPVAGGGLSVTVRLPVSLTNARVTGLEPTTRRGERSDSR